MYTRVHYPKNIGFFFQIHHGQASRARRWKTSWWSWRQWHRTARPSNWHPMLVPGEGQKQGNNNWVCLKMLGISQ